MNAALCRKTFNHYLNERCTVQETFNYYLNERCTVQKDIQLLLE
jgi:hypothetical protein